MFLRIAGVDELCVVKRMIRSTGAIGFDLFSNFKYAWKSGHLMGPGFESILLVGCGLVSRSSEAEKTVSGNEISKRVFSLDLKGVGIYRQLDDCHGSRHSLRSV